METWNKDENMHKTHGNGGKVPAKFKTTIKAIRSRYFYIFATTIEAEPVTIYHDSCNNKDRNAAELLLWLKTWFLQPIVKAMELCLDFNS